MALRAVTGEIAASPLDTMSWGLAALVGGGPREGPRSVAALSFKHSHRSVGLSPPEALDFERNWYFTDLEIDLLSPVVFLERSSDHLSKRLKCHDLEDRELHVETVQMSPTGCFCENQRFYGLTFD